MSSSETDPGGDWLPILFCYSSVWIFSFSLKVSLSVALKLSCFSYWVHHLSGTHCVHRFVTRSLPVSLPSLFAWRCTMSAAHLHPAVPPNLDPLHKGPGPKWTEGLGLRRHGDSVQEERGMGVPSVIRLPLLRPHSLHTTLPPNTTADLSRYNCCCRSEIRAQGGGGCQSNFMLLQYGCL